jgi:hypothetical protein
MRQIFTKLIFQATIHTIIFLALALTYYVNITVVLGGLDELFDFGSFIASGQLAAHGENPYADDSPLIFSVDFEEIDRSGVAPNLNPPITVLVFEQLANIRPLVSIQVWRVLSILFYIATVYLLVKNYAAPTSKFLLRLFWAFSLAGFWHTIELGQLYTLLLALVTGIIMSLKKKTPLVAGVLLGILIAIKPNFIFWAFALWVAGYWSTFVAAGITALSISLLPVYVYGFRIYEQWFEALNVFTPNLLVFPGNNSLQGLTARFDSTQTGIVLGSLLSIAILFVIYKKKPPLSNINSLAIITSLLISPIAWTGYTLLLLPSFMKLDKWKPDHWLGACIFAFPFYIVLGLFEKNFFNLIFFGWFYGWGLLILLFSEIKSAFSRNLGQNFIF